MKRGKDFFPQHSSHHHLLISTDCLSSSPLYLKPSTYSRHFGLVGYYFHNPSSPTLVWSVAPPIHPRRVCIEVRAAALVEVSAEGRHDVRPLFTCRGVRGKDRGHFWSHTFARHERVEKERERESRSFAPDRGIPGWWGRTAIRKSDTEAARQVIRQDCSWR